MPLRKKVNIFSKISFILFCVFQASLDAKVLASNDEIEDLTSKIERLQLRLSSSSKTDKEDNKPEANQTIIERDINQEAFAGSHFRLLPDEVMLFIFENLTNTELLHTAELVCKRWHFLARDPFLTHLPDFQYTKKTHNIFMGNPFHIFLWRAANDQKGPEKLVFFFSEREYVNNTMAIEDADLQEKSWPEQQKALQLETHLVTSVDEKFFDTENMLYTLEEFRDGHTIHFATLYQKAKEMLPSRTKEEPKQELAPKIKWAGGIITTLALSPHAPEEASKVVMDEYFVPYYGFTRPSNRTLAIIWEHHINRSTTPDLDNISLKRAHLVRFYVNKKLNPKKAHQLAQIYLKTTPASEDEKIARIKDIHWLALRYANGDGLPKDTDMAKKLWMSVEELGYVHDSVSTMLTCLSSRTVENPPVPHDMGQLIFSWRTLAKKHPEILKMLAPQTSHNLVFEDEERWERIKKALREESLSEEHYTLLFQDLAAYLKATAPQ